MQRTGGEWPTSLSAPSALADFFLFFVWLPFLSSVPPGPCIFRLEHGYQSVGPVCAAEVLDQNDFVIVTEKNGNKRTETGPRIMQRVFGETYSRVLVSINVNINEFVVSRTHTRTGKQSQRTNSRRRTMCAASEFGIAASGSFALRRADIRLTLHCLTARVDPSASHSVICSLSLVSFSPPSPLLQVLLDKANNAVPRRQIRGPAKVYPTPDEEVVPDQHGNNVRKCVEINDSTAISLEQPDGLVHLDAGHVQLRLADEQAEDAAQGVGVLHHDHA